MVKKRNAHIIFAIFVVLTILWVLFGYYCGIKIREKHILSQGIVTSISKGGNKGRTGPTFTYKYYRKGELTSTTARQIELKNSVDNFVGKSFPVVYRWNGIWYDDNILITPFDFNSFGYPFPDSLNWVLEYIEK